MVTVLVVRIKNTEFYSLFFFCQGCMPVCSLTSVMSNSLWPHGLRPARLLCPGGFSKLAMPSSRASFWPRDQTRVSCVSCIGRWTLLLSPPGKPLSRLVKGKIFAVAREEEHDLVGKRRQVTDGGLTQIPAQSLNDKVPLVPNSMPVDSMFHIYVWVQRRSACSGQSFSFWQVCALDNSVFGFFLGFHKLCFSSVCCPLPPSPVARPWALPAFFLAGFQLTHWR